MSGIRSIWPFVRPYRRVLALGCLIAVLEVVVGLAHPWPLRWVVDEVLTGDPSVSHSDKRTILALACLSLAVIVGLSSLFDYWSTRILSSAGLHLANAMRESVYSHINHLSLKFHGNSRVGDLSSRVTSDVDRAQDMIVQFLALLVPNALLLVGMVTVMLLLDPLFALVSLALTPLLVFTVLRATNRLREAEKRARSADGQVAAAVSESFNAIQLVQVYSLEPYQQKRFDGFTRESLSAGLDAVKYQARFSPAVDATAALSTIAVMWFGATRVMDNQLSLGEFLVFISYVGTVYKPLKALAKLGRVASKGSAAAERVRSVLAEQPQIVDGRDARRAPNLHGSIRFHDVTYSYGREPVLDHLELTIAAGETVALVGPTGAGKSTIASLIPRLIDPTAGVVEIDGKDIRLFQVKSLRRQVSMVLQDTVLLHGTIFENIAVGRPNASADDVRRASKLALVDEFAERLPFGLYTALGERGANLSGGQRQRIAIARAILRNSPILILDEPTSALDTESEQLIVEALSNLPRERTTIVIAHRLSTVRQADRIFVVESGAISQVGSHSELIGSEGRYRDMHAQAEKGRPLIGTSR